jgi:phosphohistidine phosphatase
MRLYFLRHADAIEGRDDAKRPLSERGIAESHFMAFCLRRSNIYFDAAYTSPLVRAQQTAGIVFELCRAKGAVDLQTVDALLNETSQQAFGRWLGRLPAAEHVLLVGHAPSLAERACVLLGLAATPALTLPKAGLACVETEDRTAGILKLFLAPKPLGLK